MSALGTAPQLLLFIFFSVLILLTNHHLISFMSGPLPESVQTLLSSSTFLHLGTCANNVPHVSLMHYAFIQGSEDSNCELARAHRHLVVLPTPMATTKFRNLQENPRCSLLVHDWVSAKPTGDTNVLELLQRINQSEVGELSATLDACVVKVLTDKSAPEYAFFKGLLQTPEAAAFVEGDDIALVVVRVLESKVSDQNNRVESFK